MSKLLKAVAQRHRPHLAAKMTKENGYDETKHLHPSDLQAAGIFSPEEASDLADCIEDLAKAGDNAGGVLKAAKQGDVDPETLNAEEFIKELIGDDPDVGPGDDDYADEDTASKAPARA